MASNVYMERFVYDDGGRAAAGFKGYASDCVVRAIAIATDRPYREVYGELQVWNKEHRHTALVRGRSVRDGVATTTIREYLAALGWRWTAAMTMGSGCHVHLRADELPGGRLIVRCSKHLVAVLDGVIHDTGDVSRGGTRCVYGWFVRNTLGSEP